MQVTIIPSKEALLVRHFQAVCLRPSSVAVVYNNKDLQVMVVV